MPKEIDFRCSLFAYHLLCWELAAVLAPEEIKIDLYELIRVRGCSAITSVYMDWTGRVRFGKLITTYKECLSKGQLEVHSAIVKLSYILKNKQNYHLPGVSYKKIFESQDFDQVWKLIAPNSMVKDSEAARRIN